MGQTCNTGSTGGGTDSPPTGLICCPEGVCEQSVPRDLSVRMMSLGIPPQVIPIVQGWLESTPDNAMVSHPYPDPPPHWGGGGVASPRPTPLDIYVKLM